MKLAPTLWDAVQAVLLDYRGVATVHQVAKAVGCGDDVAGRILEEARDRGILTRECRGKTYVRVFQAVEPYYDSGIFQIPAVSLPTSSDAL